MRRFYTLQYYWNIETVVDPWISKSRKNRMLLVTTQYPQPLTQCVQQRRRLCLRQYIRTGSLRQRKVLRPNNMCQHTIFISNLFLLLGNVFIYNYQYFLFCLDRRHLFQRKKNPGLVCSDCTLLNLPLNYLWLHEDAGNWGWEWCHNRRA
jgi:hypothetical protein